MKTLVIGILGALILGSTANAENVEMDFVELREGKVSSK